MADNFNLNSKEEKIENNDKIKKKNSKKIEISLDENEIKNKILNELFIRYFFN